MAFKGVVEHFSRRLKSAVAFIGVGTKRGQSLGHWQRASPACCGLLTFEHRSEVDTSIRKQIFLSIAHRQINALVNPLRSAACLLALDQDSMLMNSDYIEVQEYKTFGHL